MHSKGSTLRRVEVQVEISSTCGLRCVHCSGDGDGTKATECPPEVRSPEALAGALSRRFEDAQPIICFTGGEPLESLTVLDYASACRARCSPASMGVFTSGCIPSTGHAIRPLTISEARDLRRAGIAFAYLSLYSSVPEAHDSATSVPGSHQTTIDTLENLLAAGVDARVHFVPMKFLLGTAQSLSEFLVKLGVSELRFLRLVKHGRATCNWDLIGLSRGEQLHLLKDLDSQAAVSVGALRITAAGFPEAYDCRPFAVGSGCQAGKSFFYIDHKGTIYPCGSQKNEASARLGSLWEAGTRIAPCSRMDGSTLCWQDGLQEVSPN